MQAFGLIVPVIDLNTVINDIRGRPIEEAEDLLSQRFPLKDRPVIEVAPDWLGRVPLLPFNIDASIELGEESTEKTSEVSMVCAFLGFSPCALVSTGLNVWPKPQRSERLPGVGI